ncbi:MAG: transcription elongation factor GreA [Clostridia bacterium]
MKEVFITKEGLCELKERLEFLIVTRRKEVAENLQRARELGDLSENAEYDAAKDEQSRVESEIKELEEKILYAVIIEDTTNHHVSIGNTVEVLDVEYKEKMTYRIVGTTEANVAENKISNESPLGRALLGKKEKDIVDVGTPNGGSIKYKIISIK